MKLDKIYREEDLFPREITTYEEKITDLDAVLRDIVGFYTKKGIVPNIYQSISEEGYFSEIETDLKNNGFELWTEAQKYMMLTDENILEANPEIEVREVSEWNEEYGTEIYEKSGEPWGIDVVKRALCNSNTIMFVAFYKGKPVGMTYCHIKEGVSRVDYLLVSKECRNIGVGRAIISRFVDYCNANHIDNCYLWPDGETAEKIYYEAGFRHMETKVAGRAVYKKEM